MSASRPEGGRAVTNPVTIGPVKRACPICQGSFTPIGRRRYCAPACRAAAYRRRRAARAPAIATPPAGAGRALTIYECPSCAERYLGRQRCHACDRFCRRVGLGGPCPHCDEPVALADLLDLP